MKSCIALCALALLTACGGGKTNVAERLAVSSPQTENVNEANLIPKRAIKMDGRTNEALENLDKISKGAAVYYATPHVLDTGQKLPCQFPANVKSSPAASCCAPEIDTDGDGRCNFKAESWMDPSWPALSFSFFAEDQHRYVYEVKSSGTLKDAKMEIFAYGDLDCDGEMSTFKRTLLGDPQANFAECAMQSPGPIEKINPNE